MKNFLKRLFRPKTDLTRMVNDGALIIDVRTKNEFDSGHIHGSKNIPLDAINKAAGKLKDLNRPIITVCRSGARSGMAKSILSATGIEVYNGGAWTILNKQLERR